MLSDVARPLGRRQRHDTSVKSTTDLCEDGSESDDDSLKVNARISADVAGDYTKNKCSCNFSPVN